MTVACAVLAAGGSRRLGQPKQLLNIDGQPLVKRIVEVACASHCEHVAVVLGAAADEVQAALGPSRAVVLHNAAWASEGMSASMHLAVLWARALGSSALLLAACDQPYLTVSHLDTLHATYLRERRSVASAYAQTLGVPALIEARLFDALLAVRGDRGAAGVLRSEPHLLRVAWPEGAVDLDTPADVERVSQLRGMESHR